MTQSERILRHLEEVGPITQAEALQEYGIMRLASRISDLKKLDYPIGREMIHTINRYGEHVSYARYHLNG